MASTVRLVRDLLLQLDSTVKGIVTENNILKEKVNNLGKFKSIGLLSSLYFKSLLGVVAKFLNMSKATRAFTSSTKV